jgi:RHS repeat-associated protein
MRAFEKTVVWLLVLAQSLWAVPLDAATRPGPSAASAAATGTTEAGQTAPVAQGGGAAPRPAAQPNRRVPSVKPVPRSPVFSSWPTVEEIFRARIFEEPLVPIRGTPTPEENRALARALQAYLQGGSGENVLPLVVFLEGHSISVWRASLQLNLGLVYVRTGYYTRAVRTLEDAWAVAKGAQDARGRAIADRALGELLQISSRVGRHKRLEELLEEAQARPVGGRAGEMVEQAKQALWLIRNHPDRSLLCGPVGLDRILAFGRVDYQGDPRVRDFLATAHGTTLREMNSLANQVGLGFQMAKRVDLAGEMPTPALIHWNSGHFSALLRKEADRFFVEDPAFGAARWISRRALDDEASGYALVGEGPLPRGWRPVDAPEADHVWGMGPTSQSDPQCQSCRDHQSGGSGGGCQGGMCPKGGAMAGYSFHTMLVSLHVFDTPVGYAPPRGPGVEFQVNYHQREVFQPQVFTYSNLGPKWTSGWISYIEDDPTVEGQPANLYLRAGGQETHTGWNATTQSYGYNITSRAQVVRVAANPVVYERRLPDGSVDVYGQPNGALSYPRKVFLTRSIDPQGNAVELTYDQSLRIVAITDAIGQVTTLSYDLAGDPFKITAVTDPFGRSATFDYDAAGRLSRITDVIGIQSSFAYGPGDFVEAMTTPYGTTKFRMAEEGRRRWLEATDSLGGTERLEYLNTTGDGMRSPETDSFPYGLPSYPTGFNPQFPSGATNLWYRNTFYWSKRAMALAPGKYTAAKLVHWLHTNSLSTTAGVIENEKEPLETMRTFYKYPGMTTQSVGTHATPSGIGRQMEDGTSQIWAYEYNARGRKTKDIDPLGRETVYVYGTNNVPDANPTTGAGVDMLQVKRKNGGAYDLIASYTYNASHQPLTVADARGAVTTYTYNAAGQVLTVTTPPAQGHGQGATTSFTYDTNGHLTQVSGPVPGATTSFSYDSYGRKHTSTDATALTLTYDYDALDRVTKVTYPDTTWEETVYKWLDAEKRRDRLGRWTQTFYDALRRPLATRDATGQTTHYQYGGSGCTSCSGGGDRLTKLVDPNGNATTWDYDLQGRVTQETRADGSSESYAYDMTSSRLEQKTDRKNVTTTFEYFLDGSLKRRSYSDTTPAVNITYDPVDGTMLTAANGTDTLTWTYDNMDRVATEASTKNASTVGYTYDDAGNRTALSLDGVTHVTYGYDQQSRLTGITRGANAFGFAYDTASRRTSMTYPNGVVTSYGYDGESRLTSLGASLGATPITSFGYVLDAAGNRTRKTTLDWAEDYRYDNVYRLVSADRSAGTPTRWRFAYDTVGNRTGDQTDDAASGASFNNRNQLLARQPGGVLAFKGTTSEPASVTVAGKAAQTAADNSFSAQAAVGSGTTDVAVTATDASGNARTSTYRVSATGAGAAYSYDPNGNLTSKTEGTDTWTYTWNAVNQLTKVEKNGAEVDRFSYDPLGRRVEKVAGGVTTTYAYDGEDILREVRGASILKYLHGLGIDEPLAREDGAGALTYYHADGLGSIVKHTAQTGAIVHEYRHDAWGNLEIGASEPGYSFTGREWDPEIGLYQYRARYYEPKVGRFVSEDPIGLAGGVNRFSYVVNKPTTLVDPSGLKIQMCSRPAEGMLPGNHVYFYNPDTGENCGRGDNSGKECPDDNTTCQTIPGSEGSEGLIMANCEAARRANWAQWWNWRPFTNDCHNFNDYVMRQSGFPPQTAPGGRFGPTAQPYRPDPRDSMCYGGVCMQTGPRDF